jgi:hypothetical protein
VSENLKPCPFCGGGATLKAVTKRGNGGCDLFSWKIKCRSCEAQFPLCEDKAVRDEKGIRLTVDGREILIEMWNSRIFGEGE